MSQLPNARWELFSQNLAKGIPPEKAYAAAGYKSHRQSAHRLMTKDDVRRRVGELQEAVADANRPDMARCLRELPPSLFPIFRRL